MNSSRLLKVVRCALVAAIGCALTPLLAQDPPGSSPAVDRDVDARIDDVVRSEIVKQHIPGVAIGVVRRGTLVKAQGYGRANVEHDVAVDANTIFQSGSLGKQFTAAAVMLQVEDGKLALSESLGKFFPDAPAAWRSITIRHLLTHTSGIPDYTDGTFDYRRDYTEDQLAKFAYGLKLESPPGSRWNYSNTGYVLLGIIVRKVSGRFYGDVLAERVFGPLGMKSARIIDEAAIVPHRAAGYRLVNGELKNQEWVSPSLNTTADGALYLSVHDFLAWDAAVRARRVLSASSWDEILKPVRLNSGKTYPYGFGWAFDERGGQPVQAHGGAWQGFKSYYARYLGDDLSIIVFANLAQADPQQIADGVAAAIDPSLAPPPLAPIEDREPNVTARALQLIDQARAGTLARADFAYVRAGFFPDTPRQYAKELTAAGRMQHATLLERKELGDDRVYSYELQFADRALLFRLGLAPDGRISTFALRRSTRTHTGDSIADLKTTAEASDFKSTSTYDDVVKFIKAVDAASPDVYYTTYGTTTEGRLMPLAVVGTGLKDSSPAAVKATGKLRVHIQANVHAGEVEGKESAQILLRELAAGQHADWLKSTVFLITPIFNADGNEKFSLTNRQRQNGPINGMGTRANAQGLNINRDFVKLDTPEGRAFVKLWVDYDPHVGIDLHTSNGSYHAYYLTYSPPLNPNTNERVMHVLKDDWFPFVTKNIKARHGWDTFYYGIAGNPDGRGGTSTGPLAWRTFEHGPRFHNNYVGLRNRFGLLSEAYAYAAFEDRIKATNYFLDEVLTFAHENAARLKTTAADADKERIVGSVLSARARIRRGGMVDILVGEVEEEKNPNNGAVMNRRKNVSRVEPMIDMMWFEPTLTETVPRAYYIPGEATKALELLTAHGIQTRQLQRPVADLERFTIESNQTLPTFEGHAMRRLEGKWQPAPGASAPARAWEVPMDQPLARLAFYMLEPASDDGLVTWNVLDDLLKDAEATYPILRKR